MIYTCEACGKTFQAPPSQKRRFCSIICRTKVWLGGGNPNWKGGPETRTCLRCGSLFEFTPSPSTVANGGGKFCSRKCHDDFRRKPKDENRLKLKDMRGSKHPRWSGPKSCKNCGRELLDRKSRRRGYCSDECQIAFGAKSRAHKGNKSSTWKGGPYKNLYCKFCGKQILTKTRVKRVFCSRECMGKWNSENKSGKNAWAYRGGPTLSKYPTEFNPSLRRKVRRRDGNRCRICYIYQKGLDVHHIDGGKMNSDTSNLIALCRGCYRRVHAGSLSLPG